MRGARGRAAPRSRENATGRGSNERAYRVGIHLPDVCYLTDLRDSAPHPPRWGALTVPQTPPQPPLVPRKPAPAKAWGGGEDVVGRSCGWGGCLRCGVCLTSYTHGRLVTYGRVRRQ
jgi:hypothetical protein